MSRPSAIWYRKQTGWYMTTIHGRRYKLSKDYEEAKTAFHQLLGAVEKPEPCEFRLNLKELINLYLEWVKVEKSENTYKNRRLWLQKFLDFAGRRKRVADFKPHVLERFLQSDKEWTQGTRATLWGIVQGCMNWGVEREYISRNPFKKVRRGELPRTDRILTDDEKKLIFESCQKNLREFFFALDQTGARPFSEVASITADMVNWDEGTITFVKHKMASKGKKRTIYLTPELLDLLKELRKKHPTGYLFQTKRGQKWHAPLLWHHCRRIEKKHGLKRFTGYAFRHTFITTALAKGLTADIVAKLVGNSPNTIHKHYEHLEQTKNTLRDAAQRVVS